MWSCQYIDRPGSCTICVRHSLKHMKEGSCIINTTSVNAFKGNAPLLDYTSTKGAILAFTRGLALQLVKRGIRVNGKELTLVFLQVHDLCPFSLEFDSLRFMIYV